MAEIEALQTQLVEMRYALDQARDEKVKLGIMYEESLKEKAELEKKIEFLSEAVNFAPSKVSQTVVKA